MNILPSIKIEHLAVDGTNWNLAAGQTNVNSDEVDMAGYDGVVFLAIMGDNAATGTIDFTVKESSTSGGTFAAITGATSGTITAAAADTDWEMVAIDVFRPQERYLYLTTTRGTANMTVDAVIAIKYQGAESPITQGTGTGQFVNATTAVVSVRGS